MQDEDLRKFVNAVSDLDHW